MKKIRNLFIQGVMGLLPIVAPILIMFWIIFSAEAYFGKFIKFSYA